MSDTNRKKSKKSARRRRKAKLVVFAVEIVVLLIVLGVLFVALKLSKLDSGNKIEAKKLQMNDLTQEKNIRRLRCLVWITGITGTLSGGTVM